MFSKLKDFGKKVKGKMNDTIRTVVEALAGKETRAIAGIVILCAGVGVGGGLILSAYVPMPN